jgi:hypothetical protein
MRIKLEDLRKIIREELVAISPTTDYVLPSGNLQDADPMAPVVQAKSITRSATDVDTLHDSVLRAIRNRANLPVGSPVRQALDLLDDATDAQLSNFVTRLRGVPSGPNRYHNIGIGQA